MQPQSDLNSTRERIDLRRASSHDFGFAFRLYKQTMEEYSSAYIQWDDERQKTSLTEQWNTAENSIITCNDTDIGWLALLETESGIMLGHFYVDPRFQGRGIGSTVLRSVLATAAAKGKSMHLSVLKNNPVRRLYERFGFVVVGEDGMKYAMRLTHGL